MLYTSFEGFFCGPPFTGFCTVLYRFHTGFLQVLYRFCTGFVQVLYRFCTCFVHVCYRFTTGFLQVCYMFSTHLLQVFYTFSTGSAQLSCVFFAFASQKCHESGRFMAWARPPCHGRGRFVAGLWQPRGTLRNARIFLRQDVKVLPSARKRSSHPLHAKQRGEVTCVTREAPRSHAVDPTPPSCPHHGLVAILRQAWRNTRPAPS